MEKRFNFAKNFVLFTRDFADNNELQILEEIIQKKGFKLLKFADA